MKKNKAEPDLVGKCGYCEKCVYSDQKYEVIPFSRPLPWEEKYKEAPVHAKCLLPMLKRFNQELIRDNYSLQWLLSGFKGS